MEYLEASFFMIENAGGTYLYPVGTSKLQGIIARDKWILSKSAESFFPHSSSPSRVIFIREILSRSIIYSLRQVLVSIRDLMVRSG